MKKIQDRIISMQKLMEKVEKNTRYIEKFLKEFELMEKEYNDFVEYYQTQWLQDYESSDHIGDYTLLNEDSAYNDIQDFYQKKKQILKKIAENI